MKISPCTILLSLSFLLIWNTPSDGQIWKKVLPTKDNNAAVKEADDLVQKQLRADVAYLAADNMDGRLSGTNGEMLAGIYIQKRMTMIGLLPYGKSYTRSFKFDRGTELSPDIRFSINNKFISVPEDAFPANFSTGGKDENYVLPESKEANNPWVVSLYESEMEARDPQFNWEKESYKRAKFAVEHGATSVLFYDKFGIGHFPQYKNQLFSGEKLNVPVLFLTKKTYDAFIAGMNVMQPLLINIVFKKITKSGTNVMGFINNNANQTVIIAAHYDHIGNGSDFSDNKQPIKEIYNGANDNASGVAAMLAIAEKLKQSPEKKFNYLFIAFSAEEYGAAGSKAFVKASDFVKGNIAYMVNLDMVGRLTPAKQLWVNGIGSSLSWGPLLNSIDNGLKLIKDSTAVVPSDEASFYAIGISVLSFSSGPNEDYHKSGDIISKINFVGEKDVVNYVFNVIQGMNDLPSPLFTTYQAAKAYQAENDQEKAVLGIMPDYKYDKEGVKVDGIIVGKPASKAGVLQGDIIMQIANYKITTMDSYKDAMTKFKVGDQVKLKLKRYNSIIDYTITF